MIVFSLVNTLIAMLALVVSICSLYWTGREYDYKIDPAIGVEGMMGLQIETDGEERNVILDVSDLKINIVKEHNLQAVYLIGADYQVSRINKADIEECLTEQWKEHFKGDEPDLTAGGVVYHYEFILLKGLDDSYELYLLYSRAGNVKKEFGACLVSGAELLELEKGHQNEEDFEGEKLLEQKYREVMTDCKKYCFD